MVNWTIKSTSVEKQQDKSDYWLSSLKEKVAHFKKELSSLKNQISILSSDKLQDKSYSLDKMYDEIQDSLDSLKSKISSADFSIVEREINSMKSSFDSVKSSISTQLNKLSAEVKTSWWLSERFWNQWNDLLSAEKWKSEPWINWLRAIWWIWVVGWWIWLCKKAVDLVKKWVNKVKSRFSSDEDIDEDDEDEEEEDGKKQKKVKRKVRKKTEEKEWSSWWKNFFWWSIAAVGATVGWVQIYKNWNKVKWWFKDIMWLNLPFDEAKQKVEAEVKNWINSDDNWAFRAHFDGISFNEESNIISSYGQETKIDYQNRKLEWLDVVFSNYEELIHAANLTNFAKRSLKWRWASDTPFSVNGWWDIQFDANWIWNSDFISGSDSSLWSYILWTTGTVWWWLLWYYVSWVKWLAIWALTWWISWYVWWSVIDDNSSLKRMCSTLKSGTNLDLFVNYLNRQQNSEWKSLREVGNQKKEPENTTPIHKYLNEIISNFEETTWINWNSRNLLIDFDESNPEKITVESYGQKTTLTLEWCNAKQWEVGIDFNQITNIHIEKYKDNDWWDWLDINFINNKNWKEEWLKEAIRTINLTNYIREKYKNKWAEYFPFAWGKYKSFQGFWLDMDTKSNFGFSWSNITEFIKWWVTIVSHDALNKLYPTIVEDLSKSYCFNFSNDYQQDLKTQAKEDSTGWSQYLKFLHQMTNTSWVERYRISEE